MADVLLDRIRALCSNCHKTRVSDAVCVGAVIEGFHAWRAEREGLVYIDKPHPTECALSAVEWHIGFASGYSHETNFVERLVMIEQNLQNLADIVQQLVQSQSRQPTAPDTGKTPLGLPGVFQGMPGKFIDDDPNGPVG